MSNVVDFPIPQPFDLAAELAEARQEVEHLHRALESRHRIGMAQGLLMARYGLNEDAAFRYLVRVSQDTNTKLRDVASRVVEELRAVNRTPSSPGDRGAQQPQS